MEKLVGTLNEITRYPVKSFRGESVQTTTIESYGLYGDRSHAFLDETRAGKFLTATQLPEMIGYAAEFNGEENLEKFPSIKITSPEGKVYKWGDETLTRELEELSGRMLSPIQYEPAYIPFGAIEEEHILLTTDASLKELEKIWENKVDNRRFRPNFLITLNEEKSFIEETWFGKSLLIGEAEIEIIRYCDRCMIVTIDPDTCDRQSSLLRKIVKERSNHFGVYASVKKTGKVSVGDLIYLKD
ncbi:MOSC domain-containing protein [Bacillus taeanensis]|uniref:MOSC domain-containing protein n=1 Tax=Bacillus taeanensis TaxID=273032 RepID=A0A366XXC4_9BACI|nr:MOSC N-terminal beta barrel domain-containing protein [Bacillus taeanensis]RBW69805.1 MOSC domain-containing protein [Bacillus taeanensis]